MQNRLEQAHDKDLLIAVTLAAFMIAMMYIEPVPAQAIRREKH